MKDPTPPPQVFIAFIAVDYITSCQIALEILIEIHQSGSLPKQLFCAVVCGWLRRRVRKTELELAHESPTPGSEQGWQM